MPPYTSAAYGALLAADQRRQRVGRPGACRDTAVAERSFATLEAELLDRHAWPTRRQAELARFVFIAGWYTQHRRHSAPGSVSPADVERRTSPVTLAA